MKNNNYRNNHIPLSSMYLKSTKYRLPYLDSVAYIITQAAQIQQIRAKSDSGDVRHAEKKNIFCRSYKNLLFFFFRKSSGSIICIREPTPLSLL